MKLYNQIIYILFVLTIFILPYFSFENYSILTHTTSHLGAQGSPTALWMNIAFVTLSLTSLIHFQSNPDASQRVLGSLFSIAFLLTGIFPHAPLVENIEVNYQLDMLHSIFATTTGFLFTFLAFSAIFAKSTQKRHLSVIAAVISILSSILMYFFPQYAGIIQRALFIYAFYWILFI